MNGQLKRFIIVLVSFVTLILLPFWLGIIAMRMHIRGWEDYVLQWLLGFVVIVTTGMALGFLYIIFIELREYVLYGK
jgi:hypothetical protein